ncbi:AEC family transporter [Sunxiuqinia sp. A32]|uniref:AEC family transporter n=1 Tax=Sunxiuqinia sp. A32 TaxID=3461496 RepID=UPI0040453654
MQSYWLSFSTIAPLFLVILGGIIFSRTKVFRKEWIAVLNDYALWIGFPALILVALIKLDVHLSSFSQLLIWNSAYIVFCILLAFPFSWLFKLNNENLRTLVLAFSFGNVAYLGIPVLLNFYGQSVLAESTMLSAVYLFWLFTLAIVLVEVLGSRQVKFTGVVYSLLKNPLLLAVFAGVAISLSGVKVPEMVFKSLDLFSSSVTAVVLFSLGLFLGSHPLGDFKEWLPVFGFSVLILLVIPYGYFLTIKFTAPTFDLRSSVLDAAMPMGLTPYVLAVKYKLNASFASRVVVLSTLLAVFTIPLWSIVLA